MNKAFFLGDNNFLKAGTGQNSLCKTVTRTPEDSVSGILGGQVAAGTEVSYGRKRVWPPAFVCMGEEASLAGAVWAGRQQRFHFLLFILVDIKIHQQ